MVVYLFRTRVSTLFILQRTSDNILKQRRLDSRKNSAFSKNVDFPKPWPIHTSSPDNFKYLRFGAKIFTKFLIQLWRSKWTSMSSSFSAEMLRIRSIYTGESSTKLKDFKEELSMVIWFIPKISSRCNSLMHLHEHEIHLKKPSSSMKTSSNFKYFSQSQCLKNRPRRSLSGW